MPMSVDSKRLRLTNEAGTEGVLVGFRCRDCGIHVFGPMTFCQGCTSDHLEPVDLSQHGTLYSYTIVPGAARWLARAGTLHPGSG